MGWHLAGHDLEHGMKREARKCSPQGLAAAREAGGRVAERFAVRYIDHATLAEWRAEQDERSLYVFDVRHPDEYEGGHLPGSRSAPGGQLVQETDHFVATLRARIGKPLVSRRKLPSASRLMDFTSTPQRTGAPMWSA